MNSIVRDSAKYIICVYLEGGWKVHNCHGIHLSNAKCRMPAETSNPNSFLLFLILAELMARCILWWRITKILKTWVTGLVVKYMCIYIYVYICIYIDWLIIWSFPSHGWAATNVKACYDICRVYIWQPQLESKNLRIFFFGSYIENDLVGSSNFSTILIFVIRCSVKNQNFHLYATCLLVRRSWSWRGYVISLSWCLWWQTGVDAVGSIF